MNSYTSVFIVFALFFLTFSCRSEQPAERDNTGRSPDFEREIHFLSETGDTISTIRAAVAETENQRNLGLMDVYTMPPDGGMIFLFDDERPRSFWMANTPLSLDIMYINSDKEIVRIHQNTIPFSERQIPSGRPAQYVVEVHGGYSVNYDIREGMYIEF